MKVTFIYGRTPSSNSKTQTTRNSFEFPDTVKELPDLKQQLLTIASLVSSLSSDSVFFSCPAVGLRNFSLNTPSQTHHISKDESSHQLLLRFERYNGSRIERKNLRIETPVLCPFVYEAPRIKHGSYKLVERFLLKLDQFSASNISEDEYLSTIKRVSDEVLFLLCQDPPINGRHQWSFVGFHPSWIDREHAGAISEATPEEAKDRFRKKDNKSGNSQLASPELVVSNSSKTQKASRVSQQDLQQTVIEHKRFRAQPGVFKGVLMRSQTEIRFAAQLEKKGIHWQYELERLSETQYLVDFYLPDFGCWVEVKVSLEPRDEYQLPEVARYLEMKRREKLFVYTPRHVLVVTENDFVPITHEKFWSELAALEL